MVFLQIFVHITSTFIEFVVVIFLKVQSKKHTFCLYHNEIIEISLFRKIYVLPSTPTTLSPLALTVSYSTLLKHYCPITHIQDVNMIAPTRVHDHVCTDKGEDSHYWYLYFTECFVYCFKKCSIWCNIDILLVSNQYTF